MRQYKCLISQWARKLKKSRTKKLVKSNKSISGKNFFDQIPFFAISKMIFELLGKKLKLAEMQFLT